MEKTFNETGFLASVNKMSEIIPNVKDDKTAKNLMCSVMRHGGFGKNDTFNYLVSLIAERKPELLNRRFDVQGWRRIYSIFIQSQLYPKFGKALESKMELLATEYEYKVCFTEHARLYGLDPEHLLNEIKLDCIGWNRIYVALRTLAVEKGVAVHPAKEIAMDEPAEKRKAVPSMISLEPAKKKSASKKSVSKAVKVVDTHEKETVKIEKKQNESETSLKVKDIKGKRGYNLPILQYARKQVFDSVAEASASTGIPMEKIMSSIESKPSMKVDTVWKYAGNSKTKVIQFNLIHAYKNQNDINKSSLEVCGKRIFHNNVVPKLKEWKQTSREEYVWLQMDTAA